MPSTIDRRTHSVVDLFSTHPCPSYASWVVWTGAISIKGTGLHFLRRHIKVSMPLLPSEATSRFTNWTCTTCWIDTNLGQPSWDVRCYYKRCRSRQPLQQAIKQNIKRSSHLSIGKLREERKVGDKNVTSYLVSTGLLMKVMLILHKSHKMLP